VVELHAPIVTLGFIKRTWEKEVACHAFKESFKATWEKIPAKIALQTTSPIRPNKRRANRVEPVRNPTKEALVARVVMLEKLVRHANHVWRESFVLAAMKTQMFVIFAPKANTKTKREKETVFRANLEDIRTRRIKKSAKIVPKPNTPMRRNKRHASRVRTTLRTSISLKSRP